MSRRTDDHVPPGVAGRRPAPRNLALLGLAIFLLGGVAIAGSPTLRAIAQRPFAEHGTVVVPDRFVRPWDPVTVFFEGARGPAAGGPEDAPERIVTFTPDHPGAWTWLDAKTLQFRPAEMWPALERYAWTVDGRTTEVATLMTPPSATLPADGAEGLGPVETITLTFAERLDAAALARMVTIELRPLPGVDAATARWLGSADFRVKALEETPPAGRSWSPPAPGEDTEEGGADTGAPSPDAPSPDTGGSVEPTGDTGSQDIVNVPSTAHRYVLTLDTPIPLGTRAIVHFRLSRDDAAAESVADVAFATAEPFRVARLGCGDRQLPVTPEGVVYAEDQAVACAAGRRTIVVDFTARPAGIGPVEARNLLRIEPDVADLAFTLAGKRLEVSGRFAQETAYRVTVVPTPLLDVDGRALELTGESVVPLWFPRRDDYLRFLAGEGLVERHGPQLVPMEGRGQERVDLRIYTIDPLDRDFWPYPQGGVTVDESARPPGPGEEPDEHTEPLGNPAPDDLAARIALLGSPGLSRIVPLPLGDDRDAATFGLDLAPHLAALAGKGTPGAYLVGIRTLDGATTRSYLRLQVTDLSLSTIEETGGVRFVVTSLASGSPVAGATVRLEGALSTASRSTTWETLATGRTGGDGAFAWAAPGNVVDVRSRLRRIVVEKGPDRLVLDADHPPASFADNHWRATSGDWLQWGFGSLEGRGPKPAKLCTLFSERPMYRPEEPVHLKGWVRERDKGVLTPQEVGGRVVVEGPGDLSWRLPVTTSATGGFYVKFAEDDLPSGTYQAHFEATPEEARGGIDCGRMSFQMEAYRLPTFEATIHAPDTTPLDGPFDVRLVASYFAGGRVAGQPVRWRVTQFPATWTPGGAATKREGFLWSSDGRYSGEARFDATPRFEAEGVTDAEGGAAIVLDPSIEPTAQPRTYVVEATVTGEDDQTVTTTKRVEAVPAFVLGLKVARYLERSPTIPAEILVAGPDGKARAGQAVTVRLFARRWDSHLQASDFSDGKARYVTDVVDEKVSETVVTSALEPTKLALPAARAGVYVVEIESRDRLGRAQVVKVDLYVGGAEPVAWQKPQAGVFTVATDRATYDPGANAALVVQSPFQKADALVIVEAPEGNRYQWVSVTGGAATVRVPIERTWVPRVPVHVVLMRGRVPGTEPLGTSTTDLGKPATLASTTWLTVNPVENQVVVKVENPTRATPGQTVPITVKLTTPQGKPVAGEVTLWLVDQAVLTLAKEQRLDPLPDFITAVRSFLTLRDTRNLAFGRIPFAEMPGGDGGAEEESPLERAAVRRNFETVPYYEAALEVGPDGVRTVKVKLPDDLTVFKIRAKAAAGPDRFGVGTSEIAVRLPVLVQPALPRFVRPGDRFDAAGVARVVEGAGGAGTAGLKVEGLVVTGSATSKITLDPNAAAIVSFPVTVATPGWTAEGEPTRSSVMVRMGVGRTADGASDAFEVSLPIRADRDLVVQRELYDLGAGGLVSVPGISEPARPGTLVRSYLASDDGAVVRMAGALDFFEAYPYGTTEARVSRARAYLALGALRSAIGMRDADARLDRAVAETLAWLPGVVDGRGRVAQWPGARGTVSLTAWAVHFLVEAKADGRAIDDALLRTLGDALVQALRSDYGDFVDGEAYIERASALDALAATGRFDAAYFAELARAATFLEAEGVAGVVIAGAQGGQGASPVTKGLATLLGDGVLTRLWQGREVYAGLPGARKARSGLVLPSETRTVARIARALTRVAPEHPKLDVLREALVTLGRGDGWGSTNANAEAMLALVDGLTTRAGEWKVEVTEDGRSLTIAPTRGAVGVATTPTAEAAQARASGGAVVLRVDTRYLPVADGGQVAPAANGFVVARTLELVRADGPSDKIELTAGARVRVAKGGVVEDRVQVVVPEDRTYVAIEVPLAAGLEPLNPRLATAPPEATPRTPTTRAPTYADWRDDVVVFYYVVLPKGTYELAFRARATVTGDFVQPPAKATRLYDAAVTGWSAGARVVVE